MRYQILAAGKPALDYARRGISLYHERLGHYAQADLRYLKAGSCESVSADLSAKSVGTLRVILDERGTLLTTEKLVEAIDSWEMRGEIKTVSFLIGASDGHTPALRDEADLLWALSPLTLQHELALLVLLEQLYRAHTIKKGEPYHR